MRMDIMDRKSEVENWIYQNKSKAFICRQFKCKPITLDGYLIKMGIEYKGNQSSKGVSSPHKKSALEYSKKECVQVPKLRQKILEEGIKEEKCEMCGRKTWMGNKIPLELHHIDGNRYNNDFGNLQLLCPNCHSLTPNHSKKK